MLQAVWSLVIPIFHDSRPVQQAARQTSGNVSNRLFYNYISLYQSASLSAQGPEKGPDQEERALEPGLRGGKSSALYTRQGTHGALREGPGGRGTSL